MAVRVRAANYPVLRRAPGFSARGALLAIPDRATARALERYEGPDYRAAPVTVIADDGQALDASTSMDVPGRSRPEPVAWRFAAWRRRDKAAFVRRIGRRRIA